MEREARGLVRTSLFRLDSRELRRRQLRRLGAKETAAMSLARAGSPRARLGGREVMHLNVVLAEGD